MVDEQLKQWVRQHRDYSELTPIPGDAGQRKYYRVQGKDYSLIAVDAPPQTENNVGFVSIAKTFAGQGLNVPEILAVDYDLGYLLLSDLGNTLLLQVINDQNADAYYTQAFADLMKLQCCTGFENYNLPTYDRARLQEELTRFHEWYLIQHLKLELTTSEMKVLTEIYDLLIDCAIKQPMVCVHRDFHSRNLMLLPDDSFGVIDFQDAVIGPNTYDLVSLLRDCYLKWPQQKVQNWIEQFWQTVRPKQSCLQFSQDVDWMGLQRHIKVLGTFARLFHRDNKANYLQDIPRILRYVMEIVDNYPEFNAFQNFLTARVLCHESNDISGWQRNSTTSVDR